MNNAAAIKTGETVELNGCRVHCWGHGVEVTNLTNAGKRGKIVDSFYVDCPQPETTARCYLMTLQDFDYARVLSFAKDSAHDGLCRVYERQEKGVRVAPAGRGKRRLQIGPFRITLDWQDFSIRSVSDPNEPVFFNDTRADAAKARAWVEANQDVIADMTHNGIVQAMRAAGVKGSTYCGMD